MPEEPIRTYCLNTVTYGLASSPYQAIRTLHKLALDEYARYPKAVDLLLTNTYLDDLLGGSASISSAKHLLKEMISLLKAGGFLLGKWTANHPDLIAAIPSVKVSPPLPRTWHPTESHHMLGISWEPVSDSFNYHFYERSSEEKVTKRKTLSFTGRLFDPVG